MEKNSSSLLAKIKSKYILQEVLCSAYGKMKQVLKLIKYNKSLLNKLDINIKENYKYEFETKIEKKISKYWTIIFVIKYIIFFIFFLAYIIKFYVSGKFNAEILKEGYNLKKKRFVDFMDNYILLIYFGFIIASLIFMIIFFLCISFAFKKYVKLIIIAFIIFVDLSHYIAYIIKLAFTIKLIKKELFPGECTYSRCSYFEEEKEEKNAKIIWFYSFDIVIIVFLSLYILFCFPLLLGEIFSEGRSEEGFLKDDIIKYFINQFNGINIYTFELPDIFHNLSVKEKNEIVFGKENLAEYKYKSNTNIYLISNKINDIRRNKTMHLLNRCFLNLPDFMINEKTKMYFYPNENVYKLSPNFYVFKYPKDEFQNHINNNEIRNIITNELLDEISIIEKNEFEYISLYKGEPNNNNNNQRNNNDINININSVDIKLPRIENNRQNLHLDINTNIDIANTEDRINDISERLSVSERNDKQDYEVGSIRNIKINKNAFQEK